MSAPKFFEEHRTDGGCFTLLEGDAECGYLSYRLREKTMVIEHTVVPPQHSGKGHARLLVERAADYAREKSLLILPQCSYASHVLRADPKYISLLSP